MVRAPGREPAGPVVWRTRSREVAEFVLRFATTTRWADVLDGYDSTDHAALQKLASLLVRSGVLVAPGEGESAPSPRTMPEDIRQCAPAFEALFERLAHLFMSRNVAKAFALYEAVGYVVENGVPGALVECGVWKGASSALAASALVAAGRTDRDVFLFDPFDATWPDPDPVDGSIDGLTSADKQRDAEASRVLAAAADASSRADRVGLGLDAVRTTLHGTGYPAERIHLVPGFVEDTLPSRAPDRIALLRLDTDFYRSTLHELEHLYPRLSGGGVLIVDDYPVEHGAKRAVDEYFARLGARPFLHRIGVSGRLLIKPLDQRASR